MCFNYLNFSTQYGNLWDFSQLNNQTIYRYFKFTNSRFHFLYFDKHSFTLIIENLYYFAIGHRLLLCKEIYT